MVNPQRRVIFSEIPSSTKRLPTGVVEHRWHQVNVSKQWRIRMPSKMKCALFLVITFLCMSQSAVMASQDTPCSAKWPGLKLVFNSIDSAVGYRIECCGVGHQTPCELSWKWNFVFTQVNAVSSKDFVSEVPFLGSPNKSPEHFSLSIRAIPNSVY
jgi:hypothetical protein